VISSGIRSKFTAAGGEISLVSENDRFIFEQTRRYGAARVSKRLDAQSNRLPTLDVMLSA